MGFDDVGLNPKPSKQVGVKWEAPVGCDDVDSKPEKPPDAALAAEVRLQNGTPPAPGVPRS